MLKWLSTQVPLFRCSTTTWAIGGTFCFAPLIRNVLTSLFYVCSSLSALFHLIHGCNLSMESLEIYIRDFIILISRKIQFQPEFCIWRLVLFVNSAYFWKDSLTERHLIVLNHNVTVWFSVYNHIFICIISHFVNINNIRPFQQR